MFTPKFSGKDKQPWQKHSAEHSYARPFDDLRKRLSRSQQHRQIKEQWHVSDQHRASAPAHVDADIFIHGKYAIRR